jgi:hypothetical protein
LAPLGSSNNLIKELAKYSQFREFQKSQKKAARKRKASEQSSSTSDSDSNYSQSIFKHDVLVRKRIKENPNTELVGKVTINGKKQPIIILVDTGSSSTIVLKKSINKNML